MSRASGTAILSDCSLAGGRNCRPKSLMSCPRGKQIGRGRHRRDHVACGQLAVADGRLPFLSSANLTEYAFSINMELGVLVTGGVHPVSVERQFQELTDAGALVAVRAGG